jgi:hypothetical protein
MTPRPCPACTTLCSLSAPISGMCVLHMGWHVGVVCTRITLHAEREGGRHLPGASAPLPGMQWGRRCFPSAPLLVHVLAPIMHGSFTCPFPFLGGPPLCVAPPHTNRGRGTCCAAWVKEGRGLLGLSTARVPSPVLVAPPIVHPLGFCACADGGANWGYSLPPVHMPLLVHAECVCAQANRG